MPIVKIALFIAGAFVGFVALGLAMIAEEQVAAAKKLQAAHLPYRKSAGGGVGLLAMAFILVALGFAYIAGTL